MRVGIIGIGAMGRSMALRLLRTGHKVVVFNRTQRHLGELELQGAVVAKKIKNACCGEFVISILSNDLATREMVLGKDGVISSLPENSVHISMGTIGVKFSRDLSEMHSQKGRSYVAAPVFGRPDRAEEGKLVLVVGGKKSIVDRCRPLFDVLGKEFLFVGTEAHRANLLKPSGNMMLFSAVQSLGEAIALIRKHGIDPKWYIEFLTRELFSGSIYKIYGDLIARNQYDPAAFKLSLGLKDLDLVLDAGKAARVPLPVASVIRERFVSAIARNYGELDCSALGLVCAEDGGLTSRID